MNKIIITFFLIFSMFTTTSAEYYNESIESFINSPSESEIINIENIELAYCEQVFLEAFMRREFSESENEKCSDIFESKIEAQMNYMRYVMGERGIY